MNLISTRNSGESIPAIAAVLKGIARDGGLFVPEVFPIITLDMFTELGKMPYHKVAARVLSAFFGFSDETAENMTRSAYARFDDREVVPIQKLGDKEYVIELFHGPTLAFKDMALQVLPRLMERALQGAEQDVLILTATSGDTGKAALEGFCDVPRTRIATFYPADGVAQMQRLQMVTQEGENTYVCGVQGNFDDAQTAVKRLFADPAFVQAVAEKGYTLSSANSINFGRLCPQIAYYLYAYARLVAAGEIRLGEEVNIAVPTGNFGNILAAYYAKRMGLPVERLICASNKNTVLTDFFEGGVYSANREFYRTISPSMDILISSNLERLLFELYDRNPGYIQELMHELNENGRFTVDTSIKVRMSRDFYAGFADEYPTMRTIKKMFDTYGYLMDPHTAVAQHVYEQYNKLMGTRTPTILASTASPFKFSEDVLFSINKERVDDPFLAAQKLASLAEMPIPEAIGKLAHKKQRFSDVARPEQLGKMVLENL